MGNEYCHVTLFLFHPEFSFLSSFCARLSQESLVNCTHCWDTSELGNCYYIVRTQVSWDISIVGTQPISISSTTGMISTWVSTFTSTFSSLSMIGTSWPLWATSWVSTFTYTTKVNLCRDLKWVSLLVQWKCRWNIFESTNNDVTL